MANGGKHLKQRSRRIQIASIIPARPKREKVKRREFDWRRGAPKIIILLLLCVLMLSPLRSCMLFGGDYIGRDEAKKIVMLDARVDADKAEDISAEVIKLDEQPCYKIEFTCADKTYSYIVAADDGRIIASSVNAK